MNQRVAIGASLALAMLAASIMAASPLQSGPQPGAKLSAFEPLHVNGPTAGQHVCLV